MTRPAHRFRWWRVGATLTLSLTPTLFAAATAGAEAEATPTTALAVQVASPARAVHGSDGREHVEYDLVITNAFTAPVLLQSIQVRGAGRVLLTLRGSAVAAHTFPLLGTTPTATISPSSAVKTLLDVVLPSSFGTTAPRQLTHVIRYSLPSNAPIRSAIGSTAVDGPTLETSPQPPIRIASPLRGSGWTAVNGCCADPTSAHRALLLPSEGSYQTPEIFAIDWIRVVNGRYFTGNGSTVADYPDYGTPVHAVADGTVVSAVNDRPQVPPNTSSAENHTLLDPADYSGNSVIEMIGPHEYATYAHMQTGSVRVRPGEQLRTGQVIGRLGNSGNTTSPHLHFGIVDRPDFFSDSLPFAISSFVVQGAAGGGASPGTVQITGAPHRAVQAEPLVNSVVNFGK